MWLPSFKHIWQLSLLSFIIAGITGFLYRYGMLYPLPDSLNFANIRHAHSHLMFFNWVSPPIMAWMASFVIKKDDSAAIRQVSICLYSMLFLGFLSYPFFLLYGYQSVGMGSAFLPIAAIISGLIMITWYWYAWLYFRYRSRNLNKAAVSLFDASVVALIISSLGAWGVSVFQFSEMNSPQLSSAMTHFFLAVFTEGWAVLGAIGMMWSTAENHSVTIHHNWLWLPALFGCMLIFPFSLTHSLVSPLMLYTAKTGMILIIISLGCNLFFLSKNKHFSGLIWKTVLILLALKILFQVSAVFINQIWPGEHGLRVLYLHLILLGFVSVIFLKAWNPASGRGWIALFTGSAILVILGLVMISGYWPPEFSPPDIYFWIMIAAILPVIPATGLLIKSVVYSNHQKS